MGRIALWNRSYNYVKNKQNLSVNFLVSEIEDTPAAETAGATENVKHYKHTDIRWGCLIIALTEHFIQFSWTRSCLKKQAPGFLC